MIAKFQTSDPQLTILKILPAGEHLAIVGFSEPHHIQDN